MPQPVSEPQNSDELINRLRVDIASTIRDYFPLLFCLTVAVAVTLVGLIAYGFYTDRTMAAAVLGASIQVAFGMVIGFVCVYIGLMMTWFGIDAAYTIKGALGAGDVKAEGALKSASPGLLFAMAGIVLIAVSLYKPIVYQTNDLRPYRTESLGPTELPEPELPKRLPPAPAVPDRRAPPAQP